MQAKCTVCKQWKDYQELDIYGTCKDCQHKERVANWKGEEKCQTS